MISKIKIGIILGSAMVASALVYAGVAHRHHVNTAANTATSNPNPHVEQIPSISKPAAGTPLSAAGDANPTEPVNDQNTTDQQPNNTLDNPHGDTTAANNQTDAADADQESTADATAVRVHPVARVRVVRVTAPVASATSVSLARPMASLSSVRASGIVIPTGTELSLRLAEPLGSKISQADQIFSATVDHDIDIHGRTVIPAGTPVTGKVVLARAAGRLSGEATLQLQVTSVKINRHEIGVLTSVRSFGPTIQGKNKVGRFMKGLAKRMDGEEREVLLAEQTAYTFNLSSPIQIR